MTPEVEEIQQRVAASTQLELLIRRQELEAVRDRWVRGAYGEPLPGDLEFELVAIAAELRSRA